MKEHEKVGQKQVSKVTLHFVWGHFSRKQTVGPKSCQCTVYQSRVTIHVTSDSIDILIRQIEGVDRLNFIT